MSVLQLCSLVDFPGHEDPPFCAGRLTCLVHFRVPPPHVAEQDDHAPHLAQEQSTGKMSAHQMYRMNGCVNVLVWHCNIYFCEFGFISVPFFPLHVCIRTAIPIKLMVWKAVRNFHWSRVLSHRVRDTWNQADILIATLLFGWFSLAWYSATLCLLTNSPARRLHSSAACRGARSPWPPVGPFTIHFKEGR